MHNLSSLDVTFRSDIMENNKETLIYEVNSIKDIHSVASKIGGMMNGIGSSVKKTLLSQQFENLHPLNFGRIVFHNTYCENIVILNNKNRGTTHPGDLPRDICLNVDLLPHV